MAYEAWYGDDPDPEPDLLALLDSIVNEDPCHICGSTTAMLTPFSRYCSRGHHFRLQR